MKHLIVYPIDTHQAKSQLLKVPGVNKKDVIVNHNLPCNDPTSRLSTHELQLG